MSARPYTPRSLAEPPEGYTAEEWAQARQAVEVLNFDITPTPPKRRYSGEVPVVPVEHRTTRDGYGRWAKVRVPSLTYVIRCGEFVKIGTTADIETRLAAMETNNPFPLEVVALLVGGVTVERELHRKFSEARHRCEWFREEGALADWIKSGCPI